MGDNQNKKIHQNAEEQYERIKTHVFSSSTEACQKLSQEVISLLKEKEKAGKSLVLGLPTGSTPVPFYRELIRFHQEKKISFKNLITFNLDEYFPIGKDHRESYHRFMHDQLFSHIDIPKKNIHIPDGSLNREEVYLACQRYEDAIEEAGGIDLQILGIGLSGHIGFNEPGSSRTSRTRLITLDKITRQDATRDFLGLENVPHFAITMGVKTILNSHRIVLMAWGEKKAKIVARAVEGPIDDSVSASYLQEHENTRLYIDESAASELTRKKHAWLVRSLQWEPRLCRSAVHWLSTRLKKPVLKLVDEDYNENGLAELVTEHGPAYSLNIRIFNEIQHTITGWPGGKPGADDSDRPEKAHPFPKRVAIFSPEPMQDVFAMGGTINRLVSQKHDVHLVYQTSGNLGVPDQEANRFLMILQKLSNTDRHEWDAQRTFSEKLLSILKNKKETEMDSSPIREIKGMIRSEEAKESAHVLGVELEKIHFQNLQFYEKGRYRQFHAIPDDIQSTVHVLNEIKPQQIYLTGRGADPSSVEFHCFNVLQTAFLKLKTEAWMKKSSLWLYRVYKKELELHEIDMAVPLSPDQLALKMRAINKHRSQTTQMWGGEERNRQNALLYDHFGLAEYEAIEVFQRWH